MAKFDMRHFVLSRLCVHGERSLHLPSPTGEVE